MSHSITLVTCGSSREAEKIARSVVELRLAACVNILPRVTSIYSWKGKVHRDREVLLVIKSRKDRRRRLEDQVRKLHSYDVPEIIHLPVAGGSKPYLRWIDGSLDARP